MNEKPQQSSSSLVALDIREKEIVFILPAGCSSAGGTINLTGGALIQGDFNGSIFCERGAIVIAKGASFSGFAEADEVYIAGECGNRQGRQRSSIIGRALLAISEDAVVHADITSRLFLISSNRVTGQIRTLDGEPPERSLKVGG